MTKQVDFYLLENQIEDAKFKLASRLANKLLRLKNRTLIVTDDNSHTHQLDNYLWSFSGTSFVAHEIITAELSNIESSISLIHIGEAQLISNDMLHKGYNVLINLSSSVPSFSNQFARIAEIVEATDEQKAAGRMRYKDYKNSGFELKTHSLEL